MKKFFSLVLLGTIFLFPLTACSSSPGTDPIDPPIAEPEDSTDDSGNPNETAP